MIGYQLLERAPLRARNTFGVEATAALLADVRSPAALAELLDYPLVRQSEVLILGEGSNLLFAGDFNGVVIAPATTGIQIIEEDADRVRVRAEAGERWDDLVRWSVGRGLHGLENLALIPGSVGAAPIQNIGAYGADISQSLAFVEAFDRDQHVHRTLAAADCVLGYRDSLFKREAQRWVVTAVAFDLRRSADLRLDYAGVREEIAAMGVESPRPLHAAEAISRIRARKLPLPSLLGNAGSFFKNPSVPSAQSEALADRFAELPSFADGDGKQKLSAAWMIEHCGWRGFREGDAGVAAQHALVLVNHGHASGAQILSVARRVADSVEQTFGVALEPEPRIIGARW